MLQRAELAGLLGLVVLLMAGCRTVPEHFGEEFGVGAATPMHWRIVWTERPATEATIIWDTVEAGKRHELRYGTEPGDSRTQRLIVKANKSGVYTDGDGHLSYHYVRLTGLAPSTTYYFEMVSDGRPSREFHFITAPADDRQFKFLYGGDSRSYVMHRRKMNRRISELAGADDEILCLCHGGDYVYNGKDMGRWYQWLSDHELTVTRKGRVLPIVPARGNHEASGPQFDEVFDSPGGGLGKNYFATRLGGACLLINLNTETEPEGKQLRFLEKTLARNKGVVWQIANYHRAAFPAVKMPSVARKYWVPLFEKYDLDLALESDGHVFKRTCAIRKGLPDETGIVYIGEGGLGVKQRTPDKSRWYVRKGKSASVSHLQRVTVGARLRVETIDIDGKVIDRWEKRPRKR